MSNYIIHEYLTGNPTHSIADLKNIYVYFKFKAYLQTTLRCTRKAFCIKSGKNEQKVSFYDHDELALISDGRMNSEAEQPYDIEWAIAQLEPTQALIIRLHFFDGKTDDEISRLRNVTRQAVNNQKRRALNNLRRLLEREEAYES